MRPLFRTTFIALFACSELLAQQAVPLFKAREDSVNFARVQNDLASVRRVLSEAKAGSSTFDSIRQVFEGLMAMQMRLMNQPGVKMRTVYRPDPNLTSYSEMVRSANPQAVRRLSIPGKGRTTLPDSLFLCTNLEELELINWKLQRLPRSLNRLSSLREVTILNNQPPHPLKLSRNNAIKELTIRGDEGNGKLPRNYRKVKNLELLDLSRNNLTQVPDLRGSKSLAKAVLIFNDITLEKIRSRQPSSLIEVNLANNKIRTVPPSIRNFKSVRKLNFNNNQIEDVSDEIASLEKLEEISFYKNRLSSFPEALYGIPHLKVIDLYHNDISRADRLAEMKNLEILYLANNKLFTLPENLGQLPRLKELYLHHNQLSNLPEGISHLDELRVLRVNDNRLLEFPPAVLRLPYLQSLDISHNQIQNIPVEKFDFKDLRIFALVGNPWDEPTREALPEFAKRLRQQKTIVHLNSFEDSVEP
jgi:Leucine-rich repeat (LRR) protein